MTGGPTEPGWGKLWQAFHGALDAPDTAQREAVLASLEGDLRREVEELLAAHGERGDLLATPSPQVDADIDPLLDPLLEQEIGPYRLLRRLGEGGMGTVYLAQQDEPVRRRVALKIVRDPSLTADILRRFDAERQVLVMMNHPHVATAYDAGSAQIGDEELPWLAMEWVPGLPIDEFCDRYRLGATARLELCQQVASGVAHAHRKGILHRDLKETNVMVTVRDGEIVAKVIDFGIARSLGAPLVDRPAETHFGSPIGTPNAMSPEQAAGHGALEASSDVYSLGLLVHRLLAGVGPRDESGAATSLAPAAAPKRPSTSFAALPASERQLIAARRNMSQTALQGWLEKIDGVVLRALALDPSQRFQNATDFAAAITAASTAVTFEATADDESAVDPELAPDPEADGATTMPERRRWPMGVLAALLLVAIGWMLWALSNRLPVREPGGESEALSATASQTPSQSLASLLAAGRVPVAITFDDLPSSAALSLGEAEEMTDALLVTLAQRGAPATGFVNSSKLEVTGERSARIDLLRRWLAAGHDLGNHGANHLSLHHETVADYLRDIEECEPVLRLVLGERGQKLRYFRHPYLRTGLDQETKDAVEGWLAEHDYTVAAVTLENTDWMFAAAYRFRLGQGDVDGARRVAEEYLAFSLQLFAFWEEISDQLVGEPHPHILLLHANQLNADYLDQLLDLLEERGYGFAPMEQVLADPVYTRAATYAGPGGVLWQFRWAHAAGRKFDWQSEPEPPDWINELFQQSTQ